MARVQAKKTQTEEQVKAKTQPKAAKETKPQLKDQPNQAVLAMDIGTRSIIGMVGMVEDGRIKIVAVEKEEHSERAMIDGQIENIEKVASLAGKVKRRLEHKTGIRLSRVCVAAAGRALRTKRAEYELELSGSQLIDDEIISRLEAGAITRAEEAFDAENEAAEDTRRFYLVGYTVCQYYLDEYTISNLKDHRGKKVKVDLIATFLPSEVVESLYTTMNKIGLEVASLTLEPIAAINAAIPENIRLLNLVLVDIGAGTSDIAACTGGSITGYTMATVAGDEITETIMKQYLVDFSTAENIKARLDLEEEITFKDILGMDYQVSRDEIFQCIQGTSGILCKEIAGKVLEVNGDAPSALFLAGGGSKLAGLKEGLTAALGMAPGRVAIAGNYLNANAWSEEYDLNNPEYATPLGIAVSSGLNMINDSFRVILNNKPAKLFRSGSFTALNLLMMNGYNFRDLLGRAGQNLVVIVNGTRKIFYGSASEPATLLINQKEGKLSDIIHAGDSIDFVPAVPGIGAKACLGDIDGAADCVDITLNGIHVPLKTPLKSGDVIHMILPKKAEVKKEAEPAAREEEESGGEGEAFGADRVDRQAGDEGKTEAEDRKAGDLASEPGKGVPENGAAGREAALDENRAREKAEAGPKDAVRGQDARQAAGALDENRAREKAEAGSQDAVRGQDARRLDGALDIGEPGPGRTSHENGENGEKQTPEPTPAEVRAGWKAQASPEARPQASETSKSERGRSSGTALDRLGRFGAVITPMMGGQSEEAKPEPAWESQPVEPQPVETRRKDSGETEDEAVPLESGKEETADEETVVEEVQEPMAAAGKRTVMFRLNGASIELPGKEDGSPYYLMDMIQYSGIDLEHPRGVVKLMVNGAPGMFQQALREGDVVCIEEEKR